MDRLWSPWRASWVAGSSQEDRSDIFSSMLSENRDEENLILWRGDLMFVIMNLYPYNNGHVLVVPKRKVEHYTELSQEEQVQLAMTLNRVFLWLDAALGPEGYNVGMNLGKAGGAGIPKHLHVHIVPRWSADTSFMTSTAEVRVIPEALRETYERIRAVILAAE